MQNTDIDSRPAPNAWWAKQDANLLNLKWASTYSESQKLRAARLRGCLELIYGHRQTYVNYRERSIAIKVDRAVVRDRRMLADLEPEWAAEGIKTKTSGQGIIYHIPRA